MTAWPICYREAVTQSAIPWVVTAGVMAAHYMCCNGVWDTVLDHRAPIVSSFKVGTPLAHMWEKALLWTHSEHANVSEPATVEKEAEEQSDEQTAWSFITRDPLTVVGDVFEYLQTEPDTATAPNAGGEDAALMQRRNRPRDNTETCGGDSGPEKAPDPPAPVYSEIFILHGIGAGAFLALWFPSVYTRIQCCNGSTWTFATASILCATALWAGSLAAALLSPQLGACMAMHGSTAFAYGMALACHGTHNAPVCMPGVMGSSFAVVLAVTFFYITHATHGALSVFTTEEFYMYHVWAYTFVIVLRQTVLTAILFICSIPGTPE